MDASLFIGVMSALSIFYISLGWHASKNIKNHIDFFFAGKSMGVMATTATLLATQIGGGMFIGTADDPFRGLLYVLGIVVSFLILGLGIAQKFKELNIETVAGIFVKQYNSTVLAKICAVLSVATLCGILLSQTIAMHSVIGNFTGSFTEYIFPLLWFVIIIYTLLGGLKAVVMVDLVQVALVIFVFTLFFLYGLWTDTIPFLSLKTLPQIKDSFSTSSLTMGEVIRILIVSCCYSIITQDIAHRFFAAKNKKTAKHSALYASIILFAFAIIPFYLGIKAVNLVGSGTHESPLFLALESIAGGIPLVIGMCALMAAITSTVDSLLCAVATIISELISDISKNIKNEVLVSKLIIISCGMFIFIASYFVPKNIITTLIDSYEISVVCLFVSIIAACIKQKRNLNRLSAYLSVGLGFTGFILSKFNTIMWIHFWTLPIALSLSLFGYLVGEILAKHKTKQA